MTEEAEFHCSFCGNHKDDVQKLITGESVAICSDCVTLCQTLIEEEKPTDGDSAGEVIEKVEPYAIMRHLDKWVVG